MILTKYQRTLLNHFKLWALIVVFIYVSQRCGQIKKEIRDRVRVTGKPKLIHKWATREVDRYTKKKLKNALCNCQSQLYHLYL